MRTPSANHVPPPSETAGRTVTAVKSVVIANPTKVADLDIARRQVAGFVHQLGHRTPDWLLTTPDDPGAALARSCVEQGVDLVFGLGGDGTITAIASGLAQSPVPLAILPAGTGNLLARNLDIPLDLMTALRIGFLGRDRSIDLMSVSLGRGEQQISTVMCGTGWDAAMMDVSEKSKSRLGWGAYALKGIRTMRHHPLRMRVQVDDGPEFSFYGQTCLIANVGTLVGGLTLIPEAEPDDGLLEVMVFDPTTLADYARTSWGVLRGSPNANDPARTLLRGTKAVVTTHRARPRQIDGDLVSEGYGFVVRVLPGGLVVRVPR
jgi:diacylglycerol kinase family enzyme